MPEETQSQTQTSAPDELTQLREQLAKVQADKDFLLADTAGLRELNAQLQGDLEAATTDRIAQIVAFRDEIGKVMFGVPSVTALLNDYSRVGDLLVRTGKIPQETKTGDIFTALMNAELAAMKERGEVTEAPAEGAPVPDPQVEASIGEAPLSSPVAPPLPPPSPEVPPLVTPEPTAASAPLTPPTGPNSGPIVKPLEPPAGGWMSQPKLG